MTKKIIETNQGFTLVELMITTSIAVVMMSVVVFNYRTFSDNIALSSAGQEVAIAIRQAQTYGINVKEVTVGGGQFSSAYGIYFDPTNSPSDYYIFADLNGNKLYDLVPDCGVSGSECVEKLTLRAGVKFAYINTTSGCPSISAARSLHITFLRPNPDALINFYNNGGNIVCGSSTDAQLSLISPKSKVLTVTIANTGQILTQ